MTRSRATIHALVTVVLGLSASHTAADSSDFDLSSLHDGVFKAGGVVDDSLLGKEYYDWLYRWHRGGAFVYHDSIHPCYLNNQTCTFTNAKDMRRDILHVNTTIIKQRDFVEVKYDLGDADAHAGDFIGVYCVDEEENADRVVESADFFDYIPINATQEGSFRGSFVVGPLMNMRCSYQFRYQRRVGNLEYHCLSESPHIEMEFGHSEPTQVRLALTQTPGEMRVTWTSGRSSHQHVHFGLTPANLSGHAEASTTTYDSTDMCSDPATTVAARWFRHPGYIHEGVMKGLEPGKTYYYTVGSKFGIVSSPFKFTYPPLPGANPATSQSFFMFGDLGLGLLQPRPTGEDPERLFTGLQFESRHSATSNKTVMRRIEQDITEDHEGKYVGLVHVGDLSYAKGRTFIWDQYGALVEPVASRIPYMVAIGNHEYDYTLGGHGHDLSGSTVGDANGWHPPTGNFVNDSKGECGVPTVKRFHMPDNGNHLFWYSFRLGLTHQIILSSEHNCSTHSPMHKWLVHELRHNVNRTETPWLLVHLHRPLYCSENFKPDYAVSLLLRECLDHLLTKHNVDVVFSGHYHAYERTCPVYKEECREDETTKQPKAPIHIMIGSGGAELDDINYMEQGDGEGKTPLKWSLNRQQEYGYGRFHVFNASHAHFEFVRSRDREVTDNVWITSQHKWDI